MAEKKYRVETFSTYYSCQRCEARDGIGYDNSRLVSAFLRMAGLAPSSDSHISPAVQCFVYYDGSIVAGNPGKPEYQYSFRLVKVENDKEVEIDHGRASQAHDRMTFYGRGESTLQWSFHCDPAEILVEESHSQEPEKPTVS